MIYLSVLTTIVSFILLFRVISISKSQRTTNKTLRRLKYEINKMQEIDSALVKSLTNEEPVYSWFEEDELKKEKIRRQKQKRREKRRQKIRELRSKLPQNIEKFAGENILDKLGIASFLIGLAFFINISMELSWINDFGRLFFGIVLTIVFLLTGYFIRLKYVHFSNILIGGGTASLIFTVFAAYYQYHIFSIPIWIIAIIIIILSTILISIAVRRHEIAIITFIAAYIAPFTVNFIGADYLVLFSYLLLLNIGVTIYDYFQKSIVINLLSFGFTFIIYGVWLINLIYIQKAEVPFLGAFIFLTIYYVMFLIIIIINNVREGKEFKKIEFSVMMSAKAVYLSVGIIIINEAGVDYDGLFMGLIAIINYVFFLILYPRKNFDRRILNLFLGLSIMFFSLIIPVELYGKTITMVWALQAFVLMFVAIKSKLDSMRTSSFLLTIGMIVSLFMDLYDQYLSSTGSFEFVKPFLNEGFLTSLLAIASIGTIIYLLSTLKEEFFVKKIVKVKHYQAFLAVILAVTFYFSFFLEIKYWALQKFTSSDAVDTIVSVYNYSFLMLAALSVWFIKQKPIGYVAIGISILSSLLFIFYYSQIFVDLRNSYLLNAKVTFSQFKVHYWAALMLIIIQISSFKGLRTAFEKSSAKVYIFAAILVFFFLYTVSVEVTQFYTVRLYQPHLLIQDIVSRMHKFSYSIAWAISSLVLIGLGFIIKSRELRFIAMFLYVITFLKIVTFDLLTDTDQDLMISFAVMGFVLLLSSFMFQYVYRNENRLSIQKHNKSNI